MGLSTRTLSFLFSIRMLDLLHEKDARPYCVTSASLYLPQSTNMLLIFWETNWRIHRLLCTWLRKGEIMCRPSLSDYLPFLCFTNFKHDHWSRIRWKKICTQRHCWSRNRRILCVNNQHMTINHVIINNSSGQAR